MHYTFNVSIMLTLCSLLFVNPCSAASNLARDKPYTVSPLPNYLLSAPPTDQTSLTDGKYSTGRFWTQKTTVGWQRVKFVEILIDLVKVSVIDSIAFSTAGGIHAGVYYPAHIYAFVGPDKDHLLYVGDVADAPDKNAGEYQVKKFLLGGIKSKGKYVLLKVVTSKSNSVFCDEIEVLEGNDDIGKAGSLTIGAARTLTEQARWLGMGNELMDELSDDFMRINASLPRRSDNTVKRDRNINTVPPQHDLDALESSILRFRGSVLRSQIPGKMILVEAVNPWSQITPAIFPSPAPINELKLTLPQGGYGHAALLITNLSAVVRKSKISLSANQDRSSEIILYEAQFVKSTAMEYVADPTVPVGGELTLRPGESKMVFVTARGKNAGVWRQVLRVTSDKTIIQEIPVELHVTRTTLPKKQMLAAVNWGYLSFKPIENLQSLATDDLANHHTNVLVVPPAYLQGANQTKLVDFSRLEAYIKQHRRISKILLAIGLGDSKLKTVTSEHAFLSKDWKENFTNWYDVAEKIVVNAGFSPTQLYIYPYDEMQGEQITDFMQLSTWAKKEIPQIQFYATLNAKEALRALPYLDIAQIHNNDWLLRDIADTKTELWLYDARGPAKSLSPYEYYRLMAWKAFVGGYKGIGFWAYADTGTSGTAWDDFDGKNPDYAVIYEGPNNTIISSRRWEAWRMGIEDYELLTMYAKAKGDNAAKALAKSVLDDPQDTSKADDVRTRILLELEK